MNCQCGKPMRLLITQETPAIYQDCDAVWYCECGKGFVINYTDEELPLESYSLELSENIK